MPGADRSPLAPRVVLVVAESFHVGAAVANFIWGMFGDFVQTQRMIRSLSSCLLLRGYVWKVESESCPSIRLWN
jgi:hypothetical protein